jgi:hypothetical protein
MAEYNPYDTSILQRVKRVKRGLKGLGKIIK